MSHLPLVERTREAMRRLALLDSRAVAIATAPMDDITTRRLGREQRVTEICGLPVCVRDDIPNGMVVLVGATNQLIPIHQPTETT